MHNQGFVLYSVPIMLVANSKLKGSSAKGKGKGDIAVPACGGKTRMGTYFQDAVGFLLEGHHKGCDSKGLQIQRKDWQPRCRADRPGAGTFQHTEARIVSSKLKKKEGTEKGELFRQD
eukprot:1145694-Pelagomonas_calceolata.AAC.6